MNKIVYSFMFVFGSIFSTQSQFYTREINVFNFYEVSQAAKFLIEENTRVYDPKTKSYRDKTKDEIKKELSDAEQQVMLNQGKNQHIFVCVSSTDGYIKGILHCQYGHRQSGMVEFMKYEFFNDFSWTSFCSNSFNKDVMLSMTQYAENFYRNLSMKSVVALKYNQIEREFFASQKYSHLSKEDANKMYWTASEHLGWFAAGCILFPLALFYLALTQNNNDSYVYYKEL
jgi:site-specific recombinase XerD